MSRNTAHEFIGVSESAIEAEVELMYSALTGRDVGDSTPQKLFCQWITSILVQAYARINVAGNQNIPSRAEGEDLDALGELYFSKTRPEASAATVTVRFTLSAAQESTVVIPAGTRVCKTGDPGIVFATQAEATVAIGDTFADVQCICQTAGKAGNGIAAGAITTCVDLFPYYASCATIDVSGGGADAATDDEYYQLMTESEDAYSCAGSKGAYIYWAKSVSTGIKDVVVNSPSAGQVNIYALMDDGTPAGTEVKNAIAAACSADEVRPLTDQVVVDDPTPVSYDIEITYYMSRESSMSAAMISEAVEKAVKEYKAWQCARIGRDINPSKLIQMVIAAGAKRVEITSPVFTSLNDGSDDSAPDLAVIGDTTVTNGGYEDD